MTARFGVAWAETRAIAGRAAKREVDGVAPDLVAEFSRRTLAIEAAIATRAAELEAARGRAPSSDELGTIHRAAWRETRLKKVHRTVAEMTAEWCERARPWVGDDPTSWVASLAGRTDLPALPRRRPDRCHGLRRRPGRSFGPLGEVLGLYPGQPLRRRGAPVARRALRPGRAHQGVRARRRGGLGHGGKAVPTRAGPRPGRFRAPDGTSQFAPATTWQYTTAELLKAEARLLDVARDRSGPAVTYGTVAWVCEQPLPGRAYAMGADQAVAVEQVATSGRVCDVIVGPAGTGKSTALAGLLAVWEAEHGMGSVKGLAPSAAAAANLASELGIATENTAKWLTETDREASRLAEVARLRAQADQLPAQAGQDFLVRAAELEAEVRRWQLRAGDLLVVDEASLAGTFALDRLADQARGSRAKLLLVGDFAQLGAVGAGGAFSMLVDDREAPPELSEARRFAAAWERQASAELRAGAPGAIDAYLGHGRVAEGNRQEMLAACYAAWKADVEAGKSSLMLAIDNVTVAELNRLARSERVVSGQVAEQGSALSDGSVAGVGDIVVARHNDRHLRLADGEWVRNRDRFVVTATHEDGAMTVAAIDRDGEVLLPAGYVAEHVELGYAGTVFSAQGRTVTTAHALVGVGMTREALYVAATRAREANRLYVDVEPGPAGADMAHGEAERLSAREVLVAVASRRGADLSAHQTMASEWARASGFEQLVKEHQSLVAAATAQRWESALQGAGLPSGVLAQARQSPEWAGLLSALRDADDRGLDVGSALSELAKLDIGQGRGPCCRAPGAPAALGEADRRELAASPRPGGRAGPPRFGDRRPRPRPSRR